MKKIGSFLIIAAAFLLPLHADDIQTLTLEEAVSSAEDMSIPLQQAALTLQMALRNQDAVMTTFMPDLAITAGASTGVSFPGTINAEYGPIDSPMFNGLSVNAGVSASFTFNGTMITDARTRELAKESASLQYQTTWTSLRSAITEAYWNLAAADISIDNAKLLLEDAQSSYDSVSEMYENGLADELTLRQTELALKQAELQVRTLEDSKTLLMSAFRNTTGIDFDFTTSELPEPVILSFPSPEDIMAEYSEGSLEIRSARNQLESAKNAADTARMGSYFPILTAQVGYNYAGSGFQYYKDSWTDYSNMTNAITGSVNVTIPLSAILPGSEENMAIKDAEDSAKMSALSLHDAKNTYLEDIKQCIITIGQNQSNMLLQQDAVDSAQRSYELSEDAFNAGMMSATDLASARNKLLSEQMSLTSIKLDHLISCYGLADKLNIELTELQTVFAADRENNQ